MNFSGSSARAKEDEVFEAAAASPRSRDGDLSVSCRIAPADSAGSEGRRVVRLEHELRQSRQRLGSHDSKLKRGHASHPSQRSFRDATVLSDSSVMSSMCKRPPDERESGVPSMCEASFGARASQQSSARLLVVQLGRPDGLMTDRVSAAASLAAAFCDASFWCSFKDSELFSMMLTNMRIALELDNHLLLFACCVLIHLSCLFDENVIRRLTTAAVSIVVRVAQAEMHHADLVALSGKDLRIRKELERLLERSVDGETVALATLVHIVEKSVACRALLRSNGGLFVCACGIELYDGSLVSDQQCVMCLRVLEICTAGSEANQSYVAQQFRDLPRKLCSILESKTGALREHSEDVALHCRNASCLLVNQVARCACNLCNMNPGACAAHSVQNVAAIVHALAVVSRRFLRVAGRARGLKESACDFSSVCVAKSGSILEESVMLSLFCWLTNLVEVSETLAEYLCEAEILEKDVFDGCGEVPPWYSGGPLSALEFLVGLFQTLNARCGLDHESDRRMEDTFLAAHSALLIAFVVRENVHSMEILKRCMPGGNPFPLTNVLLEFVGMQAASEGMERGKLQAFTAAIDVLNAHA